MKITCHNKGCRYGRPQVFIGVAFRDPRDHQYYCKEECANACNPPPKKGFPFIVTFVQGTYEKKFENLAQLAKGEATV